MQTLRHTGNFERDAKRIFSEEELTVALDIIARDPLRGDLIKDTNGIRKIRVAKGDRGKSGGARIIYYYFNEGAPIYLLAAFAKNEMGNLSKSERNEMAKIAAAIKEAHRK